MRGKMISTLNGLKSLYILQPDSVATSNLDAWYMDESQEDQRLPHR